MKKIFTRSLRFKLGIIVFVFLSSIILLLILTSFGFFLEKGMRVQISGESVYAKSQRNAVYFLQKYAVSSDENDYRKYMDNIKIPLAVKASYDEIQKPGKLNWDKLYESYIESGNDPADFQATIFLARLQRFPSPGYVEEAGKMLDEVNKIYIPEIVSLGEELRETINTDKKPEKITDITNRLNEIDGIIGNMGLRFSFLLSQTARMLEKTIIITIIIATILAAGISFYIYRLITDKLILGIRKLQKGAMRVSEGNLRENITVKTDDEIGELMHSFNDMMGHMYESRKSLEKSKQRLEEEKKKVEDINREMKKFNDIAVDREIKMIELKNKIKKLEQKSEKNS